MFKFISATLILITVIFSISIFDSCSDGQCLIAVENIEACDLCHHCKIPNTIYARIPLGSPLPLFSLLPFLEEKVFTVHKVNQIFRPPIS